MPNRKGPCGPSGLFFTSEMGVCEIVFLRECSAEHDSEITNTWNFTRSVICSARLGKALKSGSSSRGGERRDLARCCSSFQNSAPIYRSKHYECVILTRTRDIFNCPFVRQRLGNFGYSIRKYLFEFRVNKLILCG